MARRNRPPARYDLLEGMFASASMPSKPFNKVTAPALPDKYNVQRMDLYVYDSKNDREVYVGTKVSPFDSSLVVWNIGGTPMDVDQIPRVYYYNYTGDLVFVGHSATIKRATSTVVPPGTKRTISGKLLTFDGKPYGGSCPGILQLYASEVGENLETTKYYFRRINPRPGSTSTTGVTVGTGGTGSGISTEYLDLVEDESTGQWLPYWMYQSTTNSSTGTGAGTSTSPKSEGGTSGAPSRPHVRGKFASAYGKYVPCGKVVDKATGGVVNPDDAVDPDWSTYVDPMDCLSEPDIPDTQPPDDPGEEPPPPPPPPQDPPCSDQPLMLQLIKVPSFETGVYTAEVNINTGEFTFKDVEAGDYLLWSYDIIDLYPGFTPFATDSQSYAYSHTGYDACLIEKIFEYIHTETFTSKISVCALDVLQFTKRWNENIYALPSVYYPSYDDDPPPITFVPSEPAWSVTSPAWWSTANLDYGGNLYNFLRDTGPTFPVATGALYIKVTDFDINLGTVTLFPDDPCEFLMVAQRQQLQGCLTDTSVTEVDCSCAADLTGYEYEPLEASGGGTPAGHLTETGDGGMGATPKIYFGDRISGKVPVCSLPCGGRSNFTYPNVSMQPLSSVVLTSNNPIAKPFIIWRGVPTAGCYNVNRTYLANVQTTYGQLSGEQYSQFMWWDGRWPVWPRTDIAFIKWWKVRRWVVARGSRLYCCSAKSYYNGPKFYVEGTPLDSCEDTGETETPPGDTITIHKYMWKRWWWNYALRRWEKIPIDWDPYLYLRTQQGTGPTGGIFPDITP